MMTGVLDAESARRFSDDEPAWFSGQMRELRRSVSERQFRRQTQWSDLTIGASIGFC
jgi:hypothetical protein